MTKCSKKCLITPGFELKGILMEKGDHYSICDNCDCGFSNSYFHYCPCCGEILSNFAEETKENKGCEYEICKYYHSDHTVMIDPTIKKGKDEKTCWQQCVTCKESYQSFFVFCPCCGGGLIAYYEEGNFTYDLEAWSQNND